MSSPKHSSGHRSIFALIFLALVALALNIAALVKGNNVAVFNPKGLIALEQQGLFIYIAILLAVVAIPSVVLIYMTAWKYRESNTKATYAPDTRHSKLMVASMWLVPATFMFILSFTLVSSAHRLEPQKEIVSQTEPLTVEVVATRWKWIFIYPEQDIATVNYVQIPTHTPVTFKLTADNAPMSSFWIPNLGGMLYAMTGHVNRLNLLAVTPGDYPGSSAEINGAGFADMKFTARASSEDDFNQWVRGVHQTESELDRELYDDLIKPTENNPVAFFSSVETGLYDTVLKKYAPAEGAYHEHGSHGGHESHEGDAGH